jgi:hypothetical protein
MDYRRSITSIASLVFPILALAQTPELRLPSFPGLQQKAREFTDISLGWFALHALGWAMDGRDPEGAELKRTLRGLKAVHVRSYEFDSDFVYPQADIDTLRAQLSGPGWSRLVQVRDRNKHEDVDIYIALDDRKIKGLALIATEPRSLTILNIVGAIDLEHVAPVEKALGVPDTAFVPVTQRTP